MRKYFISMLCGLISFVSIQVMAESQQPVYKIRQVKDDVYSFQSGGHLGMFMVTSEGIIVVDPLNVDAAKWLNNELATRFDLPVKYVLYSHYHWDHASGGDVFNDTASFISHENSLTNLTPPGSDEPLIGDAQIADLNNDGKLQLDEVSHLYASLVDRFAELDTNNDGGLTKREMFIGTYKNVRVPDEGFTDTRLISLGGKTVELIHVGGKHASDLSFIRFVDENVLFVVDTIQIKKLPFRTISDFDQDEIWSHVDQAIALDFDFIVPGHGSVGTRQDLFAYKQYYVDLIEGVSKGISDELSLEEIKTKVLLEKYRDWEAYADWREDNITGIYTYLTRKASLNK